MRILIAGASGFVGWDAVQHFGDRGFFVQPTFRSLPHYLHNHSKERISSPVQMDITSRRTVDEVVSRFQPNIILHSFSILLLLSILHCAVPAQPQQADYSVILSAAGVSPHRIFLLNLHFC